MAARAPGAVAVISTAMSGGSLSDRLAEAVSFFGRARLALEIEIIAEDFTLPAPRGESRSVSPDELSALASRHCRAAHFSNELCCGYFTYRDGASRHIVLYDDLASVKAKLSLGARLGISHALLPYPHAERFLPALTAPRPSSG
jgi:hypothetical protein